jgi:DNA-binding CsgD family transcriptional regulator/tetratricopeptide (TPR) repeat protein
LLPDTERVLFRRMAVLAGGWTLEAAEAVGAGGGVKEEDVLGLLSRLVDKSLVVAEATGNDEARYRMLEPIRQYGLERLEESGEAEEVRRRHAEFFLALAEEAEPTLMGPQQGVWLKQLETEHDNLRAALSWSLEHGEAQLSLRLSGGLWRFWVRRGHLREGRRWLEAALTKHSAAVPATRVKALGGLGLIVERGGDERKAKALFVETLKLYGELGDEAGTAISLHNLGWVAILQDELESAGERFEESLAHYRRLDDDFGAARALYGLGYVATAAADYECARAHLEEALELFHGVGDYAYVAKCLGSLGRLAMLLGELEWAEGLFEEGLARFREAGTPPEAEHLIDLGLVALGQGNLGRARRLVGEGLVIARQEGSWSRLAMGIEAMAMVASANGETRRGAFLWGATKAMRGTIGFRHYPDEHAMYRAYVEAARESLGETAWEAVFAEGRAMAPDEAVTYALSKEEPPSPAHEQAPPDEPSVALTHREREVTALVARGLSNRQIASELHLSERTVENHIAKILRKLGLASRTQVAAWATEQRLLAPDPD